MKRGFSLIEVVFAIIIIAISLMSIPMLLKESAKSNEFSMMQEAILATSTKMGNILSYPWDKNSYDRTNKILRTLDVSNGDSKLKRVTTGINDNNLRTGHIYVDYRRRFYDYNGSAGITLPDTTINNIPKQSINDFHRETKNIGGSGGFDYKDSGMSMTSMVYYIGDNANYGSTSVVANITPTPANAVNTANSTNIKMVEVTTSMPSLGQNILLRSYLSNIGQSKLLTRTKP